MSFFKMFHTFVLLLKKHRTQTKIKHDEKKQQKKQLFFFFLFVMCLLFILLPDKIKMHICM